MTAEQNRAALDAEYYRPMLDAIGPLSTQVLLEDPDEVVRGDRVLHLRFRVRR